jgi:hypothetical protein
MIWPKGVGLTNAKLAIEVVKTTSNGFGSATRWPAIGGGWPWGDQDDP